jgi:hypothetical protein
MGRGSCPREAVQEGIDCRVDPVTDLAVARLIAQHGAVQQIEGDHVVEEGGRLMRIAPPQTPRLLLLFDEPGNNAPRCLRAALEPSAPERRKARRFGNDKPLKRQVLADSGRRRCSRPSVRLGAAGLRLTSVLRASQRPCCPLSRKGDSSREDVPLPLE